MGSLNFPTNSNTSCRAVNTRGVKEKCAEQECHQPVFMGRSDESAHDFFIQRPSRSFSFSSVPVALHAFLFGIGFDQQSLPDPTIFRQEEIPALLRIPVTVNPYLVSSSGQV